jgi:ribosomal 50S subunit-associated protein YjgA (DUF615 family)
LSLPLLEIEWSKKKLEEEDDDEFEDLTEEAKKLQEQELEKVCVHTRLHMHVGRGCEVVSQIRL